jgi:hypothetical protein
MSKSHAEIATDLATYVVNRTRVNQPFDCIDAATTILLDALRHSTLKEANLELERAANGVLVNLCRLLHERKDNFMTLPIRSQLQIVRTLNQYAALSLKTHLYNGVGVNMAMSLPKASKDNAINAICELITACQDRLDHFQNIGNILDVSLCQELKCARELMKMHRDTETDSAKVFARLKIIATKNIEKIPELLKSMKRLWIMDAHLMQLMVHDASREIAWLHDLQRMIAVAPLEINRPVTLRVILGLEKLDAADFLSPEGTGKLCQNFATDKAEPWHTAYAAQEALFRVIQNTAIAEIRMDALLGKQTPNGMLPGLAYFVNKGLREASVPWRSETLFPQFAESLKAKREGNFWRTHWKSFYYLIPCLKTLARDPNIGEHAANLLSRLKNELKINDGSEEYKSPELGILFRAETAEEQENVLSSFEAQQILLSAERAQNNTDLVETKNAISALVEQTQVLRQELAAFRQRETVAESHTPKGNELDHQQPQQTPQEKASQEAKRAAVLEEKESQIQQLREKKLKLESRSLELEEQERRLETAGENAQAIRVAAARPTKTSQLAREIAAVTVVVLLPFLGTKALSFFVSPDPNPPPADPELAAPAPAPTVRLPR